MSINLFMMIGLMKTKTLMATATVLWETDPKHFPSITLTLAIKPPKTSSKNKNGIGQKCLEFLEITNQHTRGQ
jgi:hypothetical protein